MRSTQKHQEKYGKEVKAKLKLHYMHHFQIYEKYLGGRNQKGTHRKRKQLYDHHMLINDTFAFLEKKQFIVFHLLKSDCTKKELLYLHTLKIVLVCLTRFKMENKQKHQNNNHKLYCLGNIIDTHLKPCPTGIIVHFQR